MRKFILAAIAFDLDVFRRKGEAEAELSVRAAALRSVAWIGLAIAFGLGAYKITNPRQTGRGKALLADLESLFSSLKNRSASFQAGSNPNEVALLTAVFGVKALPKSVFPHAQTLYPQASSSSSGSCGSSCGGGGCGGCGS